MKAFNDPKADLKTSKNVVHHKFKSSLPIRQCPRKQMPTPFMIKIVSTCFQNAHTKLVTLYRNSSCMGVIFDFVLTIFLHDILYRNSSCMDVIFDFVSTLFLHDCSINEDCKCHFIADLANARNLRDIKAKER